MFDAFDHVRHAQHGDGRNLVVTEAAKSLGGEVDVIALAQASMSRLQESLAAATGLPVLSSPRLGVEKVRATLDALPR
jgi:Asp/Glu/hydantoin racemase